MVVPEAAYGEHEKTLQKAVKDRGAELEIVMGKIRLENGRSVDEFIDLETRKIVVRADSAQWAAEDLIDHALFHGLSQSQQKQVAEAVCERFGEEELMQIAEQYVRRMRGVYDELGEEELLSTAVSEVLADANGRMLRYEDADARKFTETVRKAVGGFTEAQSGAQTGQKYSPNALEEQRAKSKQSTREKTQAEITTRYQNEVHNILTGSQTRNDALLVGYTPEVYRNLGMPSLPFVVGSGHVYSMAKTRAEAAADGRLQKGVNYHGLGEPVVSDIMEFVSDPVMVIAAKDVDKTTTPMRSTHSVVALVDVGTNGNSLVIPIAITAERTVDGTRMDVNAISSAYEKNTTALVNEAIAQFNAGESSIFYVKKEAADLLGAGVQFPERLKATASNGIIRKLGEKINLEIENVTQSQQFKRWFGDWQNHPERASKVVNADGTPKVMYHGTDAEFTVFDRTKGKKKIHLNVLGEGNYFTARQTAAERYGSNVIGAYLSIRKPYVFDSRSYNTVADQVAADFEIDRTSFTGRDVANMLKARGYDGVIGYDADGEVVIANAFTSEQIKSATDNIGTFDRNDPDIRYSPASETVAEVEDGGAPVFSTASQTDWAFAEDGSRYYRLLGIAPPGSTAGVMRKSARAMDWAQNGQKYTQELLKEVMQRDESTYKLALKVPDGKGGYTVEAIQNTEQMQEVYRLYAEATPEDIRLDEETFWMMRRKLAEGATSSRVQVMSAEEKARAWRASARKDFKSTGALEKLGVKVERSVGKYGQTQALIEMDKAYKQANRELKRAIERTQAVPKEVAFAQQISDGVFSPEDTPQGFDRRIVMTLVDYMNAKAALGQDRILAQRKNIRRSIGDVMEVLFENAEDGKVSNVLTLNHRTAQRNMRHIFGDELGDKVNKAVFDPIQKNEAERIRFLNRQFEDVRLVEDSKGNKSELTQAESAIVQMTMEGKAAEGLLAGVQMDEAIRYAGQEIADGVKPRTAAKNAHLNREQKKLAELHASYISALRMMADGKIDAVKIDNAVRMYQQKYNELYAGINDFLVAHGYEPIGFIQNYAPHMQSEKTVQSLESALRGLGENVTALPTAIAGKTADFKPNKRWNPYFMRRSGSFTQFDVLAGFESYTTYLSDVLYHTDDIMTVRAMSDYLRRRYAPEEISLAIDQYTWLRDKSRDEQLEYLRQTSDRVGATDTLSEEQIEEIISTELDRLYQDARDKSRYSSLVVWLDNYANILAGKQSMSDRGTEYGIGRGALNLGNYLNRGFGAAKVAGNLATVLNQTSQIPNIIGEKGVKHTAQAVWDMTTGKLRKADWAQESDYLTSKKGVQFLVTEEQNMYDWTLDKIGQAQQFADAMVSTVAVRAAYLEGIEKGMSHEKAMQYADRYGAQVMGDRSKGARPVAFHEKNPLSQIVHTFQLEVANSWEHLTQETLGYDFRQMEKTQGKGKASKALAGVIVKTLIAAFFMNRLGDELYGGTPAQFDVLGISANFVASGYGLTVNDALREVIDNGWEKLTGKRLFGTEQTQRSFDLSDALEAAGGDIANDIPYLQNASALIGWGDNSLPMAIPTDALDNWINAVSSGKSALDIAKKTFDVAAEVVPGGSQIKKTARGLDAMIRGGVYEGYGDEKKLRYPVDNRNIGKWIQAVAFGPNGLSETGRYYAGEERALGKAQTAAYQAMVKAGAGKDESYSLIRRMQKLGEDENTKLDKLNVLMESNLPTAAQGAYYYTMLAAEKEQDTINTLTGDGGVIGMDDYLRCKQEQLRLEKDEEKKASEKAQEFRAWVNAQGYSAEQKSTILNSFKFYSIAPADSGAHSELYNAAREGTADYETLKQEAVAAQKAEGKTETDAEAAVNRDLRSQIGQDFKDGVIDEAGAEEMLKGYAGADEDDVYWLLREWKGGSGYKKYGAFLEAVDAGVLEDTKKAAKEYLDHGVEKGTLSSQLTSHFKNRYLEADSEERGRLKALYISAYRAIGGTRDDAVDNMARWVREAKKN